MNYFMKNDQLREEHRPFYSDGVYTLDLIRDCKRFATTRPFALGEVGESVILFNIDVPEMETLVVKVTRVETLEDSMSAEKAEEWLKLEGWSAPHFVDYLTKSKGVLKVQTTFELIK